MTGDRGQAKADSLLMEVEGPIQVSDFTEVEYMSAVARLHWMNRVDDAAARTIQARYHQWVDAFTRKVRMSGDDLAVATKWLERLDLNLRGPDALHIAIAARLEARLVTLDHGMLAAARALRLQVQDL